MNSAYSVWVFWIYLLTLVPFAMTSLFYGLRSPWWTSHIGRSLLITQVAIVSVLLNVLAAVIFDDYELRDFVRTVLLGGVTIAGWYQFGSIIREQRRGRAMDASQRRAQVLVTVTDQDSKLVIDTRDPEEPTL